MPKSTRRPPTLGTHRLPKAPEKPNPTFSTNPKDDVPLQAPQEETPLLFDESNHERGQVLGQGTFGQVHRLDPKQEGGKTLALKTATPGHDDELKHEAGTLERLGQHDNIVGYEGSGKNDDGGTKMALEFLGGGSVESMQKRLKQAYDARKISHEQYWGTMQYLMRGITSGVSHMNDKGMVHGDLKFDNVGLSEDMTPKVLDFGSSREIGGDEYGPTTPVVNYTPEMGSGEKVHGNTDVYAIGQMTHFAGKGEWHGAPNANPYAAMINRYGEYTQAKKGELENPFQKPTAFDEFLGNTLCPVPEFRSTPQEALESSFLTDGMLDDEQARSVLMQMGDDKKNGVQYGGQKTELQLTQEGKDGREERLERARVQNKQDKMSGAEALRKEKKGKKRKDVNNKSKMLKELKKKTRGTRKQLDSEAEARRKGMSGT